MEVEGCSADRSHVRLLLGMFLRIARMRQIYLAHRMGDEGTADRVQET